jgi:hypothetical protein
MREPVAQSNPQKPIFQDPDSPPLDPSNVRLFYDHKGFLRATVDNQTYLDVSIVRAFPLSYSDKYLGVLSGRLDEIGIIADPEELDEESCGVVKQELTRRYFSTHVLAVHSISEEFGATYWSIDTNRGRRNFVAKGLRDNVTYLDDGRILIHDVDSNRYEIRDLAGLDEESRSMILRVI